MTHNELAAANTAPFPEIQPPCPMVPSVPGSDDQEEAASQPASLPVQTEPAYVFVWDQVNERPWVNLPASWGPDCGRRVRLVGHVEPRAPGRKVRFTLQADPGNPPRHALAELASSTARSDGDGAVTVDVDLPIYGGARFQVSARTVGGPHVPSPPITVWRRIFYQLTTMDPAPDGRRFDVPAGLMAALQERLAAVFVDLQPGTKAAATTPYLQNVGTNGEYNAIARAALKDDRSPFKLHIIDRPLPITASALGPPWVPPLQPILEVGELGGRRFLRVKLPPPKTAKPFFTIVGFHLQNRGGSVGGVFTPQVPAGAAPGAIEATISFASFASFDRARMNRREIPGNWVFLLFYDEQVSEPLNVALAKADY